MKYILKRKIGDLNAGDVVTPVRQIDGTMLVERELDGKTALIPLALLEPLNDAPVSGPNDGEHRDG